jgi:hypothetical protein
MGARAGSGARLYPLCEWAQERRAAGLRDEEQRDVGEKRSAMQGRRIATHCNPRGGGVVIRQESDVGLDGGIWRMMDASHWPRHMRRSPTGSRRKEEGHRPPACEDGEEVATREAKEAPDGGSLGGGGRRQSSSRESGWWGDEGDETTTDECLVIPRVGAPIFCRVQASEANAIWYSLAILILNSNDIQTTVLVPANSNSKF